MDIKVNEKADKETQSRIITEYWMENYLDVKKECSICNNLGVIDTRHSTLMISRGLPGETNYCFCPKGRERRQRDKLRGKNHL